MKTIQSIALFSASILCGIIGFIVGVFIAAMFGLHEKMYVMVIGFLSALIVALISTRFLRKVFLIVPPQIKTVVLVISILLGPVAVWGLYKFVGY